MLAVPVREPNENTDRGWWLIICGRVAPLHGEVGAAAAPHRRTEVRRTTPPLGSRRA